MFASPRRYRLAAGVCFALVALALARPAGQAEAPPARPAFDEWLAALRAEAVARGIGEDLVRRALDGVKPLPIVVERDQSQPEFTLSLAQYLKRRLTPAMVRSSQRAYRLHRALLGRVEKTYGVDAATVVSIWALESNFGRFSGVRPTIATLATLAYEPRRSALFREELFHALRIVESGDVALEKLKGSWAGAMGQPQFMPSSYLRYAVDFDGDTRKDIWSSDSDVVGSIANYLGARGWVAGQRWGRLVRVPPGPSAEPLATPRAIGCRAERELSDPHPLAQWRQAGVTLPSGARLPPGDHLASLLAIDGRTYLVYANYEALLAYNCAHRYALSVATLADQIAGR